MALPPDYIDMLSTLAEAFSAYETATGSAAILVGGAATAIHTAGAFMSGDFDVVAGNDAAFAAAMAEAHFLTDFESGHGLGGWYHPNWPEFGVEQVSGTYFDGRGDRRRCLKLIARGGYKITLPAVEDLIADRLGQHAIAQGDDSMLHQAVTMFKMAQDLDATYLTRRIIEEGGNPALIGL